MAVTIKVDRPMLLPGGAKMIYGSILFDSSYVGAAGEPLNLASYLKDSTFPFVHVSPAAGYQFEHSQGNVAAGTVKAYYSTAINANGGRSVLVGVTATTNMNTVNARFMAIGQAD